MKTVTKMIDIKAKYIYNHFKYECLNITKDTYYQSGIKNKPNYKLSTRKYN